MNQVRRFSRIGLKQNKFYELMGYKSFQWFSVMLAAVVVVSMAGCVEIGSLATGGLCSLIILVLDIIAIVEIAGSNRDLLGKLIWILLILFLPVIGLIIYYFVGR